MPMTDLEIFDFVAAHLIRQGKQSRNASAGSFYNSCLYRGPYGTSCAIGCLIKDEFYDPKMEGSLLSCSSMVRDAVAKSIGRELTPHTKDVLSALQHIHDAALPKYWPHRLPAVRSDLFPAGPIPA